MIVEEIQALLAGETSRIHCIGLGGIGVSGVAEWLVSLGFEVSGSDLKESPRLDYARSLGITVFVGHHESHVQHVDCVVYTSAAGEEHPERKAAKQAGIPAYSRGQMLAALVNNRRTIVVSGSHGKTTTTALVSYALAQVNVPVSYYVGGTIGKAMSTVSIVEESLCVLEADESDASFLYLTPTCVIVTNIDADHLQTYDGSIDKLRQSFVSLLATIPADGLAILCGDDEGVQAILPDIHVPHCTYGFSEGVDYRIIASTQSGLMATATLQCPDASTVTIALSMPGAHNTLNAVAAWLAHRWALQGELTEKTWSFSDFPGVARRFTVHGDCQCREGRVSVVEDYGHHPTEMAATLEAARSAWPNRRVVMLFQPHRYTRTADLMQEFIEVLAHVDQLVLLEVYAAGEDPIAGIHSTAILEAVTALTKKTPVLIKDSEQIIEMLQKVLQGEDVLLLQGAGNVGCIAKQLLACPETK